MNENCKTPCKTEGRFSAKYWRPRPESNRGARICSPLRHHSATWPLSGEIFALLGADPTPVNTQTLYADSTGHLAAMFGKRIYVVKRRRIETPSSVIMQGMTDSEIQRRTMIETTPPELGQQSTRARRRSSDTPGAIRACFVAVICLYRRDA